MPRPIPWFWILVGALLLLAPGPAGRLVLNLVGGLTILAIIAPLVLVGAGLIGWQLLRARMRPCPSCGFRSLGLDVCPACGAEMTGNIVDPISASSQANDQLQASGMTVDVDVIADD
jgi:hypothetical protein